MLGISSCLLKQIKIILYVDPAQKHRPFFKVRAFNFVLINEDNNGCSISYFLFN